MISALSGSGSGVDVAAASAQSSRPALEANVAQYKKKLADCENCSSYDNPKGRAEIQALRTSLSTAQARLEKITHAAAASAPLTDTQAANASTAASQDRLASSGPGSRINTFA